MHSYLPVTKESQKKETGLALFVLVIFTLLLGLNAFFGYMDFPRFLISISLYLATGLGSFFGFYYSKKIGIRNFVGKSMFLFGIGYGLATIAYIIWDIYVFILDIDPYPSIADIVWSLSVVLTIIGILMLLKIYSLRITVNRIFFDSLAVFVVLSGIIIYYFGWPELYEGSIGAGFFDIFYTLTDVLLLSMAIMIVRVAGGKIYTGLVLFVIGLIVMAVGDITFAIRITNGTFFDGDFSDLLLLIAWLIQTSAIYYTAKNFISNKK